MFLCLCSKLQLLARTVPRPDGKEPQELRSRHKTAGSTEAVAFSGSRTIVRTPVTDSERLLNVRVFMRISVSVRKQAC